MKKKLLGLAIAASLSVTAFAVQAEDMYRGAWYGGAGIGIMDTDDDIDAGGGLGPYLSIGKELSQSWDLQGRFGYSNADQNLVPGPETGEYKSTTMELDALYMFSRDRFRPFLLAGVGGTQNDLDYSLPGQPDIDESKSTWLVSLGLGAQYLLNDHFGFQADVRRQASRADVLDVTAGVVTGSSSETVYNDVLSIGGFVRFGDPAPVVAAVAPEPAPITAAPAPAPAPVPVPVCETRTETFTIEGEKLFGFDKSNLSAAGKASLDDAIVRIKSNHDIAISLVNVVGHTDRLGSYGYNQKLSERRAKQVGDYLVSNGVNPSLVTTTGRGESAPVVECKGTKKTKALIECLGPNRRVVIHAQGKKEVGCK